MPRWLAIIGLASLVFGVAAPASAQSEPTSERSPAAPDLLTTRTAAVLAGDTVWLALNWQADADLTDFRVTAVVKAATVTYSETTGDYAGPYQSADLRDGEIDFTSIRVEVPSEGLVGVTQLPMEVTASWLVDDQRVTTTYAAEIPLVHHDGEDLSVLTSELRIAAGEAEWVEVRYAGIAPYLGDVRVVADVGPGLNVTYPGDGTFTSLHSDAVLEDGERDVARFLLDATEASPGVSTIELHTLYMKASTQKRHRLLIELTVTS